MRTRVNRIKTSVSLIKLQILEMMDIIIQEQKEYFIVLCVNDNFKVLGGNDYNGKNISVYNKFHIKEKDQMLIYNVVNGSKKLY